MDPTATLVRYVQAVLAGDQDEMRDANEDLSVWLRAGGFAPSPSGTVAALVRLYPEAARAALTGREGQ